MQVLECLAPVGVVDEVVPVRDLVVHRAAIVAIGYAAIHATRRLVTHRLFGKRQYELAIMADAIRGERVAPITPIDLQEAGNLAHYLYATPSAPEAGARPSSRSQRATQSRSRGRVVKSKPPSWASLV